MHSRDGDDFEVAYVAEVLERTAKKKISVRFMDVDKNEDEEQDFAGTWFKCTGDDGAPVEVTVRTVLLKVKWVGEGFDMGDEQWDKIQEKLQRAMDAN